MSGAKLQALQIFGTKRCADTKKAQRFFSERRVPFQAIDLAQKAMSAGELRAVAARVEGGSEGEGGGMEALIDRDGRRYLDRGLKFAAPTGPRIEKLLVEDPLLLRTPVVRSSAGATVGFQPAVWERWLAG